jgi:hypothetical protein
MTLTLRTGSPFDVRPLPFRSVLGDPLREASGLLSYFAFDRGTAKFQLL